MEHRAIYAFVVAALTAGLLTPLAARLAVALGAVDRPRERGLSDRTIPRLGGLSILAGVLLAGALFLPGTREIRGILAGAAAITFVGALDDVLELPPLVKLGGQVAAAVIPVHFGVTVDHFTLPFLGAVDLGHRSAGLTVGDVLTVIGLVGVMNVVNLSDGIDGLAAGVCTISAVTFAIIAFDLDPTSPAGVVAGITAGASLGFLIHNFHPASIFMGDSGSNLLGLLLGAIAIEGTLKTNALISLVGPLCILAVPVLDTGFVVAKRVKYRRPIYAADSEHFHHRFARIGFSQRRTVIYLYAWTLALSALALALRFVPYTDKHGHFNTGWSLVMAGFGLLAFAASVYLVYVLEILKFRRLRAWQLRRLDPATSEHDIEAAVAREFETGEFRAVEGEERGDSAPRDSSYSRSP